VNFACVRHENARQTFQHRRLPGTVGTDDAENLACIGGKRNIFEYKLLAMGFGERGYLE
jgi:hypothetical protein